MKFTKLGVCGILQNECQYHSVLSYSYVMLQGTLSYNITVPHYYQQKTIFMQLLLPNDKLFELRSEITI